MNLYKRQSSGWVEGLAIILIILSHYAEWWSWFYAEEGTAELIRSGISRFGPYGVAIFLLFSGYGLVKSAGIKELVGDLFYGEGRVIGCQERRIEGHIEGVLNTLVSLVKDGIIDITEAAKRANVSEEEFKAKLEKM